jgi:Kef-type K+ transport system membrane component KefB
MMTRGEVALIVAQKGLGAGIVESVFFAPVILLIIVSSVSTPILLKVLYRTDPEEKAMVTEIAQGEK